MTNYYQLSQFYKIDSAFSYIYTILFLAAYYPKHMVDSLYILKHLKCWPTILSNIGGKRSKNSDFLAPLTKFKLKLFGAVGLVHYIFEHKKNVHPHREKYSRRKLCKKKQNFEKLPKQTHFFLYSVSGISCKP
jgi:hypothetical protein